MRIDVIATPSRYEVFWDFCRHLQQALQRAKIDSELYDVREPCIPLTTLLKGMNRHRPDATIGFNITFNTTANLFEKGSGIPHFVLFVDWPNYYPSLFSETIKEDRNFFSGFVDQDCCSFLQEKNITRTFYFPHAIEKEAILEEKEYASFERDLDVVYPSSLIDPQIICDTLKRSFSTRLFNFLLHAVEDALNSRNVTLALILQKGLEADESFQLELKEVPFHSLLTFAMNWMRGLDRINLLKSIRGVKVHLFHRSPQELRRWRQLIGNETKPVFHPAVPFNEIPALFKRSKVVLTSMPMFKRGIHERILYTLASGATAVTNGNTVLSTYFKEGKGIYYFNSPNYQEVNQKIEAALSNEKARLEAALSARPIILEHHTWDARVKIILDVMGRSRQAV